MKAAIFDFDGVFTRESSGHMFRKHLTEKGLFEKESFEKCNEFIKLYRNDEMSYNQVNDKVSHLWLEGIKGEKISVYRKEGKEFLQKFDYENEVGREVVEHFNQRGYKTFILSSSPIEVIELVAKELGADRAVAGKSEVKDGVYTGEFELDLSQRLSKENYIRKNMSDLERPVSYGFGDSTQDLEFLELLGNPVVINPSRELKKKLEERSWPSYPNLKSFLQVLDQ